MFFVVDRDGNLDVYPSPQAAEQHMEANDFGFADEEFEMCDDSGQRYVAQILEPERLDGGILRFVPRGEPDPSLPSAFVARSKELCSRIPWIKTFDDIRRELTRSMG